MKFTLEVIHGVAWSESWGLWRQEEGFLLEVGMSPEWEAGDLGVHPASDPAFVQPR